MDKYKTKKAVTNKLQINPTYNLLVANQEDSQGRLLGRHAGDSDKACFSQFKGIVHPKWAHTHFVWNNIVPLSAMH